MSDVEYLSLGYPLDQILKRSGAQLSGGIVLHEDNDRPATGNIIIRGHPGTGKSTLSLQIAAACAEAGYLSAYYSLELPASKVVAKATSLGWDAFIKQVRHLHEVEYPPSTETLGKNLLRIITQPENCPIPTGTEEKCKGHDKLWPNWDLDDENSKLLYESLMRQRLLIPAASPRSIAEEDSRDDRLFWHRFQQVENLLKASEWLESNWKRLDSGEYKAMRGIWSHLEETRDKDSKDSPPKLRVVCIDSLNVFGDRVLSREHLFRIFDLFASHKVTGVFVVEEGVARSSDSATLLADDTIDYLADVVIALEGTPDKGYYLRNLEVVKNRYQPQVLGKHPYRIIGVGSEDYPDQGRTHKPRTNKPPSATRRDSQGIKVFPSVHYVVRASETQPRAFRPPVLSLGEKGLDTILPQSVMAGGSVVTLRGPRGTFKSTIAQNFLIHGLTRATPQSGLLIRLDDRAEKSLPECCAKDLKKDWRKLKGELEQGNDENDCSDTPGKMMRVQWRAGRLWHAGFVRLTELAFKTGAILPEEFIDEIRETLDRLREENTPIRRVVLDDVSQIGLSYPFLYSSQTAGDLFITAFVHLMRMEGVDLVITGTTGDLDKANECVDRASAIADTVISCDFRDIYGDRHVAITGEGLIAGTGIGESGPEKVPGVVRLNREEKHFTVNTQHLRGLVGFDENEIRRPGISLHLYQEAGSIHERYKSDIARMLGYAFAAPGASGMGTEVSVVPFGPHQTASIVDSFEVLTDAPLDKTVLCTLDEFWSDKKVVKALVKMELGNETEEEKGGLIYDWKRYREPEPKPDQEFFARPYYSNVLLLAFRKDLVKLPSKCTWQELRDIASQSKLPKDYNAFEYEVSASETLACAVLDAIVSGQPIERISELALPTAPHEKPPTSWSPGIKEELCALAELLSRSPKWDRDPRSVSDMRQFSEMSTLTPNSMVYLCWYSHLRELVRSHRELATQLTVMALPGKGFRGDWYVGINKGSVSVGLGEEVLKMLCSDAEDFKRFTRGVGLPSLKRYEGGQHRAWPNSRQTLDDVLAIYANSRHRSQDPDYKKIRRVLSSAGRELADASDADRARSIKELLPRIQNLIGQP